MNDKKIGCVQHDCQECKARAAAPQPVPKTPESGGIKNELAQPQPVQQFDLTEYDAGLLNDFGGGNVEWWQDYIRAELGRAYEHYRSQIPAQGEKQ